MQLKGRPRIRSFAQLKRAIRADESKRVELPELDRLDYLPVKLPHEEVKPRPEGVTAIGYYTPDGVLLADDFSMAAMLVWGTYKRDPANRRQTRFYRSGVPILVSTVYLGLDHGWGDGPPLIWETMVFVGRFGDAFQTRYATRAAAFAGHTVVTQTIREAQRARRAAWNNRPTRRLALA